MPSKLPADVFSDLTGLELLSLRKNSIASIEVTAFQSLQNLSVLELTANSITRLRGDEFSSLRSLRELHLGQNYLEEILDGTFANLKALDKLFLFNNNLESLGPSALIGLDNLTALLLNNNLLRRIDYRLFSQTANLTRLHVDSNKLTALPGGCLDFLPRLESVRLAKNLWHCDCEVLYLAGWLKENHSKVWDGAPTCRGPGDLGGRLIQDLDFDDLCTGQWASMTKLSSRVPIKPSN